MRVVVGSLMQESNTFSPRKSDLSDFERGTLLFGERSLANFVGQGTEVSGFAAAASRSGVELVPTMTAWASSAGPLLETDYEWLVQHFLEAVRAVARFDGVLLALHGAWASERHPDADGHILSELRRLVGPDVPIAVTLDIHANITREMTSAADVIVGYRTYPHVDMVETGLRAGELLFRAVRGEVKPVVAYHKVPMLVPPENAQTTDGPMGEIEARARACEQQPGVLAASVFPVQPWLDVPELGLTTVVVGDGNVADAQRAADELGELAWSQRQAFQVPLVPPEEAVARALAAPEGPILLVDSADGTSSGAPGDSTALLHPLLAARPARTVLLTLVDPEAARAAAQAGSGAEIDLTIGAKLDPARHRPARVHGVVELVSDGRFVFSAGVGSGLPAEMGATAVLRVSGLRIVLMEKAVPCYDPALYRSVGLEPREAHAVVVKSPTNFRWTYREIARGAIYVDAPGASTPRLTSLAYRHAPRPIYPFDDWEWRATGRESGS